ncbi:hypothetical protein GQ53DRAFT_519772 [Thozetella sp. PMI_491]|nr:hypothetical protein GQ53DRAFT_519772 [Thozetella sp. PMI_491]
MAPISFYLFLLGCASHVSAIETVSINGLFPSGQHACATACVYTVNAFATDVGIALSCGSPYDNNCFCATEAASASKASAFLLSCATSKCSAGDRSQDLTAMHSFYASYCMNAGYTQPGATDWYTAESGPTPAPGQTTSNGPTQTTTQLTVVTHTTPSSAVATQPQVTVKATSTLWVDSKGSVVPAPSESESGPNKVALGVGLGVGIPVAIALASVGIWFGCRRRPKTLPAPPDEQLDYPGNQPMVAPYHPTQYGGLTSAVVSNPSPGPVPEKEVSSKMHSPPLGQERELTGEGLRRELSGREMQNSTAIIPSSLPSTAISNHEMSGATISGELSGQSWSPQPGELSGQGWSPPPRELAGQGWSPPPGELAGHGRSPPPGYEHMGGAVYNQPQGQGQQRWEMG